MVHSHGSTITTKNYISLELKGRITLANRCYYGLNRQFSGRGLPRTIKLILYKPFILPVLLYGAEACTLLSTDAAALRAFQRKVLSKIIGAVRVGDDIRIRSNSELYEFLKVIDVVQRINIFRVLWLVHVVQIVEDTPARRVFDAWICGSWRRGRLFISWKDQIQEVLSSIVTNWHGFSRSRGRPKFVKGNVMANRAIKFYLKFWTLML